MDIPYLSSNYRLSYRAVIPHAQLSITTCKPARDFQTELYCASVVLLNHSAYLDINTYYILTQFYYEVLIVSFDHTASRRCLVARAVTYGDTDQKASSNTEAVMEITIGT
eukprot:1461030-Pleurochrysis_carterae.AAC.1